MDPLTPEERARFDKAVDRFNREAPKQEDDVNGWYFAVVQFGRDIGYLTLTDPPMVIGAELVEKA